MSPVCAPRTVLLPIEDRAAGVDLDRQRDDPEDRQNDEEDDGADRQLGHTVDHIHCRFDG